MIDNTSFTWFLFLTNLAGKSASTPRVRLWRAMKELGAGTLRDGVSLLPASEPHRDKLTAVRTQIETDGGTAWLLELPEQSSDTEKEFRRLFDRSAVFREIEAKAASLRSELPSLDEASARRRLRQLEREFDAIASIDFFPGPVSDTVRPALKELTTLVNRRHSPEEPSASKGVVQQLDLRHYQGRAWATRRRPWVDRVASAWLIRRFIDTEARFHWLEKPEDCPGDALGFDFDGGTFTHVDDLVTFEVLAASFGLETDPGLDQLGRLVHYLDVGGLPVAEAAGFEAVLAGLRDNTPDDDALLAAITPVLDALHRRYSIVDTL
jgi:hypothetical protein